MEPRKCKWCGKLFQPTNGRKFYCDDIHYDNCVVCGKPFIVLNTVISCKDRPHTCSKECRRKLRIATNIERYGGVAPACSPEVRAKSEATNLVRFGEKHAILNREVQERAKQTNLVRYGAEFFSQSDAGKQDLVSRWSSPEYKEKVAQSIKQTNLQRYGVECVFSNSDIRQKCTDTYKARTGYTSPFANPEVRAKSVDTLKEHYGVEAPYQSSVVMEQMKQHNLEKYGAENPMQLETFREKAKLTCVDKYGVDNYAKTEEFKSRYMQSMLDKFGAPSYSQSDAFKLLRMKDPLKFEEFKAFDENPENYITTHYSEPPALLSLAYDLGVGTEAVSVRVAKAGCKDLIAYVYSNMEREVLEFIRECAPRLEVITNTRGIIAPLELDIYIPEYSFAIECNPASTHNSSVDTWEPDKPPMSWTYHKVKTDKCEEKGIFLMHIFGYDWINHRDVIKSMIRNVLGSNLIKIYARNCEVREVSNADAKSFLNTNHRQGSATASIRLGLYNDNNLVSLMTFGKMRSTIGTGNEDLSDCYELVRFCSVLNTSVVGGADKLFKHFIKQYCPNRIRSFSDRAHTRGTLYSKLGFVEIRRSDPGYVWVSVYNDKIVHRASAQKQNLKYLLKDDSIDLTKTEREIMESHGFVRVYDSGTITWEWRKECCAHET